MTFAGVDIGGTFTDVVLSVNGALRIHKLLSTPDDPAAAMLTGLEAISPARGQALERVAHGSTVATNAILERKGARAAFITTGGFRDLLLIGRQNRPVLYALHPTLPPPIIPHERCYEIPERLDHTGTVLTPLDHEALDTVIDALARERIEAVAVCLLYGYLNPVHERAIRDRIVARGLLRSEQIALSSDVLPEFREYERASTTALEAYVRPVMHRYLERLETALSLPLRVMKSDGGVISARHARQKAILTVLSGPAAGVLGAFHLAKRAGFDHIITFDMGGTSTDVALCPGALVRRGEAEIDGLPLHTRILDIETVGAGGGSIARLDSGGLLRVGPESAGAQPGPIIYQRGGTHITVSDANSILGRLDSAHFLGGQMALDVDAAREAMATLAAHLYGASQTDVLITTAALGVIDLANHHIERAIRRVSVARGHDPRDFTLVAFGGAGPLHACEVAARLSIPRILIPRYPGVLCALGLLAADVNLDYSRAVLGLVTVDTHHQLRALLGELIAEARRALEREGIASEQMMFTASVDARYQGQAFELPIQLADNLPAAFHEAHRRTYGYTLEDRPVEVVNLRLQAAGIVDKPTFAEEAPTTDGAARRGENALLGSKPLTFADGIRMTPLYDREALLPGARLTAPALIVQLDTTTFLAPGWTAVVDGYRNLILER